jgi:predicted CopG family antitoxin
MRNIGVKSFSNKNGSVPIKIGAFAGRGELKWNRKEESDLFSRILKLRNDQIGVLASMAAGFKKEDIKDMAREIMRNKKNSGYLPLIVYEAKSKKDLLWWIGYFEKANVKRG